MPSPGPGIGHPTINTELSPDAGIRKHFGELMGNSDLEGELYSRGRRGNVRKEAGNIL